MGVVNDASHECSLPAGFLGEPAGDPGRDGEHAEGGHPKDRLGESPQPMGGGQHLGLVDLRDERPANRLAGRCGITVDCDGGPGGEHQLVAIVTDQGRARGPLVEGGANGHAIDLNLRVDDCRRQTQISSEAGFTAEEPIRANGVGLARIAHAHRLADDGIHPIDRELKDHHAADVTAVVDRRGDEASRCVVGGEVLLEGPKGD